MAYNLVLDEPAKDDKVEEHDGLHFVVEDNLLEMSKGFTISSSQQDGQTYFKILPEKEAADSGGCSSCSSCG
jgi:Fe-S cluster assembly iron-binding protein IscA